MDPENDQPCKEDIMKTILYTDDLPDFTSQLRESIPGIVIDAAPSLDAVLEKLSVPLNRISVAVVKVDGPRDLDRLGAMAPYLDNVRLILILPDGEKQTMARGVRLNPSFMKIRDSDMADVLSVVEKIHHLNTRVAVT